MIRYLRSPETEGTSLQRLIRRDLPVYSTRYTDRGNSHLDWSTDGMGHHAYDSTNGSNSTGDDYL